MLPVKGGNEIIPVINALGKKLANVVMTQDWHTEQHTSFASSHHGKKPFETVELDYGTQVLWPDHCVQ
jgi:nicotinamidase/pyrazinamidase